MRSGTSFFNFTVYKKTFLRFWPILACSFVFWGLILPLRGMLAIQDRVPGVYDPFEGFVQGVGGYGGMVGICFAGVFGLLAAMAVCSHLYSPKSANFMGALPIRREGLFLGHYLAGLTLLIAPNVLVFLLTALVEAAGGGVEWTPLLFWLASLSACQLFFYSFAVCLGQFTGHLLALPVFYGVFNCLAAGVATMFRWVLYQFYYGYAGQAVTEIVGWLTPAVWLMQSVGCNYGTTWDEAGNAVGQGYDVKGLDVLAIYAVVGIVLAVCALLLYRRRHLETAGDVVAVRPMRPVFVYGVALCSGLFFGSLTVQILSLETVGLVVSALLWGIAGYFVARMLLEKSFRVLGKWKGSLAVAAAFAVLFLAVGLDVTGYESRVPEAGQVECVMIRGLSTTPYSDSASYINLTVFDPEIVAEVIALHQAVVDNREATQTAVDSETLTDIWNVELTYYLTDGTTLTRDYNNVEALRDDVDTPGTVEWAVWQLLSDRDFIWEQYDFDNMEGRTLLNASCEDYWADENTEPYYFSSQQAEQLLEAVKADFADGNIGVRHSRYTEDDTDTGYLLAFRWSLPQIQGDPTSATTDAWGNYNSIDIAVQTTAARTIALLEEFGIELG